FPSLFGALLYRYAGEADVEYFTDKGTWKLRLSPTFQEVLFGGQKLNASDEATIANLLLGSATGVSQNLLRSFSSWLEDVPIDLLIQPQVWSIIEKSEADYT